jgi:AcrR family transcriptional regulator
MQASEPRPPHPTTTAGRLGRPALISRERILMASAEIGLEHLTVQAVADGLGVTRAAVYNYVGSSEELRRLAAAATVTTFDFDDTKSGDWESWLRHFAEALRAWHLTNAPAGLYIPAAEMVTEGVLSGLEQVLDLLAHAGFDHDTSVRALQFVLGVVWGNTHDQLLAEAQPDGAHPQQTHMLSQEADLGSYPRMQRAVERNSIYGAFDARFGFELDGVIRALRSALQNGEDR